MSGTTTISTTSTTSCCRAIASSTRTPHPTQIPRQGEVAKSELGRILQEGHRAQVGRPAQLEGRTFRLPRGQGAGQQGRNLHQPGLLPARLGLQFLRTHQRVPLHLAQERADLLPRGDLGGLRPGEHGGTDALPGTADCPLPEPQLRLEVGALPEQPLVAGGGQGGQGRQKGEVSDFC